MIKLTTNLSDPLLELFRNGQALVDGVEVGPWFSVRQIGEYRRALPGIPFYFHGGDLIDRVGLIPGAVSRIRAYLGCTASPWVSMHITMWLPGMVWLMLRHGWRIQRHGWHMPVPNPERATRRFIRQVTKLASAIQAPVHLENTEPLPFDGYDFEVQVERITEVLEKTGCGFVLDIAHARVSAEVLGVEVRDYLRELPLDRVVQIHVSGPRVQDGRLVDVHEPLQAIDYELLSFVLARADPQVVTLEYIRARDALREQLVQLRSLLESLNQPS
jgi:hypothetical protein